MVDFIKCNYTFFNSVNLFVLIIVVFFKQTNIEKVCKSIDGLGNLLNSMRSTGNYLLRQRRNLVEGSLQILLDIYEMCKERYILLYIYILTCFFWLKLFVL